MTMEQGVINLGVSWFRELGPYGFAGFLVLLHFLESKGLLPSIFNRGGKFKYNGNGQKEISDIKVELERRPTYKWAEDQFKELKDDVKGSLENTEKHLTERISSIHKRIDRLEK